MTTRHQQGQEHYQFVEQISNKIAHLKQVILDSTLDYIASFREVYVVHCDTDKLVDHIQRGERYEIIVKHPGITKGSYLPLGTVNGIVTVFKSERDGSASCFIRTGQISIKSKPESHVLLMIRHPKEYEERLDFPDAGFYYTDIQIRMNQSINIMGHEYPVCRRMFKRAPGGVGIMDNILFNLMMKVKRMAGIERRA